MGDRFAASIGDGDVDAHDVRAAAEDRRLLLLSLRSLYRGRRRPERRQRDEPDPHWSDFNGETGHQGTFSVIL